MFYDAYYDFGVIGVFVFSALLGAAAYLLMRMMRQVQNPITYLLYAQFALYMLLSFFTTWFSNPSTWFYFAVTAVVAFLVSHKVIVFRVGTFGTESAVRKRGGSRNLPYLNAKPRQIPLLATYAWTVIA